MRSLDLVALAVIALQGADMTSTLGALRRGGREVNPVVAWLMRRIGQVPALIVAKSVGVALAVWLWTLGAALELWALAVLYLLVVAHNLRVGRRRR